MHVFGLKGFTLDLFFDPSFLLVGKLIGGTIILLLAIGFIPGIIVGWIAGRMM